MTMKHEFSACTERETLRDVIGRYRVPARLLLDG